MLVLAEMLTTKRGTSQQKTPESGMSWSNLFRNPIANVSVKVQYGKFSPKIWPGDEKNHSNYWWNYFHQHNEEENKSSQILSEFVCISQMSIFCSTHRPATLCRHQKGRQWASALISSLKLIHRTITVVKWGIKQTKVTFEKKTENGKVVPRSNQQTMPFLMAKKLKWKT